MATTDPALFDSPSSEDNQNVLEDLYQQITGLEILNKLRDCGLLWNETSVRQFRAEFYSGRDYWLLYLTLNPDGRVVLDVSKNYKFYFNLDSTFYPDVFTLYQELIGDDEFDRDKQILSDLSSMVGCGHVQESVFDEAMHGGLTGGGSSMIKGSYNPSSLGGLSAAGAAFCVKLLDLDVLSQFGGVIADGLADERRETGPDETMQGGILCGGSGTFNAIYFSPKMSGGVSVAGTGSQVKVINLNVYSQFGGVTINGDVDPTMQIDVTGGAKANSTAVPLATYKLTTSGGVVMGQFFPGVDMNVGQSVIFTTLTASGSPQPGLRVSSIAINPVMNRIYVLVQKTQPSGSGSAIGPYALNVYEKNGRFVQSVDETFDFVLPGSLACSSDGTMLFFGGSNGVAAYTLESNGNWSPSNKVWGWTKPEGGSMACHGNSLYVHGLSDNNPGFLGALATVVTPIQFAAPSHLLGGLEETTQFGDIWIRVSGSISYIWGSSGIYSDGDSVFQFSYPTTTDLQVNWPIKATYDETNDFIYFTLTSKSTNKIFFYRMKSDQTQVTANVLPSPANQPTAMAYDHATKLMYFSVVNGLNAELWIGQL